MRRAGLIPEWFIRNLKYAVNLPTQRSNSFGFPAAGQYGHSEDAQLTERFGHNGSYSPSACSIQARQNECNIQAGHQLCELRSPAVQHASRIVECFWNRAIVVY